MERLPKSAAVVSELAAPFGMALPSLMPVYVLTHTAPRQSIPMEGGTTFHFLSTAIEDVLAEAAEAAGDLDVRVGGGYGTARDFLRAGLVDDLRSQWPRSSSDGATGCGMTCAPSS